LGIRGGMGCKEAINVGFGIIVDEINKVQSFDNQ
jgi:hypothetical protein